ncbi:MAG: hypothetical protein EVJ46_06145 [Candidatus Acididesulfobacter guangdongensis]|jgi:hypothetical protein|uniref:Uncharacterized protein n=1 Tax=Acididesulfobacter guangdongensis TaxID=2597225 RepID=A0A519BH46_ACIG2|nr:MAG: hypothetical protein EVJ46_06145 [Candidatus Acididesulfobacter guangdongensis]
MYLINKIKNIFGVKEVQKIESIQTYEDVNLFLKGYKNYFEYPTLHNGWFFAFGKTRQRILIKRFNTFFTRTPYYEISDSISTYKELYIRAFIWDHRDKINEELLIRKKVKNDTEKEILRLKKLDEEIKNKEENKNV